MKRIISTLALTAVLVGTAVPALADDPATPQTLVAEATATELPEVSITPDSPFYGLKLFVERLREFITRDAAERAELLSRMGETRLLEATQMMAAGRPELASQALAETQEKFHQAQAAVDTAVEAGKELDKLQAQLIENEANLKLALTRILSEVTEEDQPEFEAIATDVMIEFAAAQDRVAPGEVQADEAEELAPRIRAALDALAQASGTSLSEVLVRYDQTKRVSAVATELKIELEVVRAAAEVEIKIAGDEVKIEIKAADGTRTEIKMEGGELKLEVDAKPPKIEIKLEKEKKEKNCKPHPVFEVHPGRGKKC